MEKTKLSEHKKVGDTLHTPFTGFFGQNMQLTSWSRDTLPQYLWIALILKEFGRDKGLVLLGRIMKELKTFDICTADISSVIALDKDRQTQWYDIVDRHVPQSVLAPLSLVLTSKEAPLFFDHYCAPELSIDEKINVLMEVTRQNLSFHTNASTDICFIVLWFFVTDGRLNISSDCNMFADALTEYHKHPHSDDVMQMYRPSIRAAVQALGFDLDISFSHSFWNELAQVTPCKPLLIQFAANEEENVINDFYNDILKALEYIEATSGDKVQSSKFAVTIGLVTYATKLYSEIVNHNLFYTISGRILFRTMVESYINLKYIMQKESEQPDIYDMFQNYGNGKYKLVMSKIREGKYEIESTAHFDERILELYVNEIKDENFLEISLGFFDKDNIRRKFELVNEQKLYEIYYEYDTNYTHAFWGAIRESSMLICDNPAHLYHVVPDYTLEQSLMSVNDDCIMVLKKIFNLLSSYVDLPEFYSKKYGERND